MSELSVMVLAGGLGTRLRSVLPDLPKVLSPLNNRPFLTYLLDQLLVLQPEKIILCTGYKADVVKETLGSAYRSVPLAYSEEEEPLGTGGAARLALPLCRRQNILLMNGDSYCEIDLKDFVKCHSQKKTALTMAAVQVEDVSRFGAVQFDENRRVTGFLEKGKLQDGGWINAGIYLFRKEILEKIPAEAKTSLEYDVFPKYIGKEFYVHCVQGKFIDIGTPESHAKAEQFLRSLHLRHCKEA